MEGIKEAVPHFIWDSWLVSDASFEIHPSDSEAEVLPAGSLVSICVNELDL